jgi:hypothetical protein
MQTDQSHKHVLHPERGLLVLIVITMLNVGFIFYVVVGLLHAGGPANSPRATVRCAGGWHGHISGLASASTTSVITRSSRHHQMITQAPAKEVTGTPARCQRPLRRRRDPSTSPFLAYKWNG